MESLAAVVAAIYFSLIAFATITVVFSILNRRKGSFRITAVVLFVLLTLVSILAASALFALGVIPLVGTVISGLLLFLPKRSSQKQP